MTFKPRRLPARYAGVVLPFVLSIVMSGIVSFIATLKTAGTPDGLLTLWLGAWKVSWLIAFPTLMLILPLVRWIVSLLVEDAPPA